MKQAILTKSKSIYRIGFLLIICSTLNLKNSNSQTLQPYRRSSLYMLMIDDTSYEHASTIKKAYLEAKVPEKFNDHNLENRLISNKVIVKDKETNKAFAI